MRVLRVVTRLNRGGPLRQLEALVPALAARGVEQRLVAGTVPAHEVESGAALAAAGVEVVRLRALGRAIDPGADARALRALVRTVRRWQPDLVHTHMGKAGALGRLAAWLAGVPAVHTWHGHHLRAPWPRDVLARAAERALGPLTAAGIALSPRQARDLVEIHGVIDGARVHVVPPGLDVDAVRAEAAAGTAPGAAGPGPLFVWLGRFVDVKDPRLLVEAVARSGRGFHVVMLGDGPLRGAVDARVRALGLERVVSLPGPTARPAPWVLASRAVVLSSRSEGVSIAVLEAKALGRPAIVPTVGGLPDVVEHGRDGLWVPPGDADALAAALDDLAADAARAARLGAGAARDVEARFGAARLAEDTLAVYRRVLARPPGPRAWWGPPRPAGRGPRVARGVGSPR